ncbi:DnaJ domain-containing protein [Sphingomonas sp. CFBP 13603]|uniref:DnaJ domain-containing protein n=1 Tax=Sphingomonas sp. CFBP 13603 TaxID=2774040 RepID=UPI001867CB64|nr:DnaJ domain-containing protein [Sphingomonas sp. CFBP 13603]
MNQRDFYQVLGVTRDASSTDIRAAFVRLAKHHHPDHARRAGELPGRLQEVQQAYRCLSDDTARTAHDRALHESERLHFARQRSLQHRLRRYDGRHPHPQPRPQPHQPHLHLDPHARFWRKICWRLLLIATTSAVIVARALNLVG